MDGLWGVQFKYISLSENIGQAGAINEGLKHYSGEYLMWMDTDDILYQEHIQKKVEFLELHTELDFVLVDGICVYENDLEYNVGVLARKEENRDDLFQDLIYGNNVVFAPATIMVRSSFFRRVIPHNCIFVSRQGQNLQLMLPLAYSGKWGYIHEPLFKYVIRLASHSHSKRNFKEWIIRQEGFYELMFNTIIALNDMPDCEKEYWCNRVKCHCSYLKMIYSIQFRKPIMYFRYKRELIDYGMNEFKEFNALKWYINWVFSRVKKRVMKDIS